MTELKKCSNCKSTLLLETYFSKNRKGEYYKNCNGCLERAKKHRNSAKERNKDKFKCSVEECDYKCSFRGNLQNHMTAVHTKIKNFECQKCDYKFSFNNDLQRHIRTVHNNMRNFECNKCDSKFSRQSSLKTHIKQVHDKIKDFECSVEGCDAKFSTNGDLQRHIKRCTGNLKCSDGEFAVMKILDEMKIEYEYNSSYQLKNDGNKYLRWDFIVKTDSKPLFIEYDGRQHFTLVNFGGISKERAEENFKKQQQHDKLKNDFCKENDYKLLRIPYTEYENMEKLVAPFIRDNTDWGFE